jgi:hypothetical protein
MIVRFSSLSLYFVIKIKRKGMGSNIVPPDTDEVTKERKKKLVLDSQLV